MDGVSWLKSLGGPAAAQREPEWLDVLVYALDEHPGRGEAAKWLAGELGVTVRSAERYLALGMQPTLHARDAAERLKGRVRAEWAKADEETARQQVADLLRLIRHVEPGVVEVEDLSDPRMGGSRSIPGPPLSVDLGPVADAWEDEDEDAAAQALSDAIMEAYGDRGSSPNLHEHLSIVDYRDGIDYS